MNFVSMHHSLSSLLCKMLLSCAPVILPFVTDGQAADPDLKRRFSSEAPKAWDEYSHIVTRLQGSVDCSYSGSSTNTLGRNRYVYSTNGRAQLLEMSMTRSTRGKTNYDTHEMIGVNDSYAFVLQRKGPNSSWLATKVILLSSDARPIGMESAILEFKTDISPLNHICADPLVSLVRMPEFEVRQCRWVGEGNERYAEVSFVCPHEHVDSKEHRSTQIQSGVVVLDPSKYWTLRSYDVRTETKGSKGQIKFRLEEMSQTKSLPAVPKRTIVEREYVFDGGKNIMIQKYDFDLVEPAVLPSDDQFTLAAFGLPEPSRQSKAAGTKPWITWLVVAAGVVIVGGYMAFRTRRKAQA